MYPIGVRWGVLRRSLKSLSEYLLPLIGEIAVRGSNTVNAQKNLFPLSAYGLGAGIYSGVVSGHSLAGG